ncbi:MAG: KH domain-containing protein [Archaeoglobaceae archaeon]|nr:KH domain-containing protein [Archaeoglobaceae archaeon]MCX8152533.1 KH domain-containing protein [Archaeoglobaceae archaeon]MDW8014046.1 KH domain-containing protein [Archaeoglobaceae archaeon]
MELEIEVPEDRIAVLVGKDGEVKKRIEDLSGCKVSIKEGVVKVKCEDPVKFIRVKDVINAIAKGFNPEVALKLLKNDELVFEVLDLTDFVSNKDLQRVKGRIIGKDGKMRKQFEDLLDVKVSVYDKYVSIIGEFENVSTAKEAVMMLVEGAQHSTVMKFMERKRKEMKTKSLEWI